MPGMRDNNVSKKRGRRNQQRKQRTSGSGRGGSSNITIPALKITLPYATTQVLTEAAGGIGQFYTFALNDVFDPDFSGTGQQPIGYDQYSQFYGRTRVLNFRWEVDYANQITSAIRVGVVISPQSTMSATPAGWPVSPFPGSKCTTISGLNTGGDITRLSGSVNLANVFGVTRKEFENDMDFAATTSTSPSRKAYMHVWIVGYSVAAVCRIYPRLYYMTEFSQAVALSLS